MRRMSARSLIATIRRMWGTLEPFLANQNLVPLDARIGGGDGFRVAYFG